MARPKKTTYTLAEKLQKIREAGIRETAIVPEEDLLPELNERLRQILQITIIELPKANEMIYFIMYDITDDKVRNQVAKYLIKNGCTRIQKSVFMVRSENKQFREIHETLKEVNSYYENQDSIILVPVNAGDIKSMKLIGKNVQIERLTDNPNTLFF